MVDSVSNPKQRRRAAVAALAALTTVVASLLLTPPAFAAGGAIASILEDGSAIYDDGAGPGRDTGGSNGIVRRGDVVVYNFQYNFDGAGATDPVIRSELPAGMSWDLVPVDCSRAGSSITAGPNGLATILNCNLPSTPAAVSGRVTPVARVLAANATNTNGGVRTVGFTLSDAAGVTAVSNTVDVTISADPNPYFDLAMNNVNTGDRVAGPIINGPDGPEGSVLLTFWWTVNLARPYPYPTAGDTVRGVEPLAPSVTFLDDLSGMPPFSVVTGCGGVASTFRGPNSGGGGLVGVTNSGGITCTPTGDVTITNADTSVSHFPRNYAPPPKVISRTISVAIPNSVVRRGPDGIAGSADDGSYPFTHRFTNFDPSSPNGVSNFAAGIEPLDNNVLTGTVIVPTAFGGVTKRFGDTAFDRRVSAGATLTAVITSANTNLTAGAQTVCDVFDHTAYQLGAIPTNAAGTDSFVIEYGHPAAYPSTSDQLANANCGNSDAVWSTDPTDPALTGILTSDGYRQGIDRVRVRWTGPVTPNVTSTMRVVVRVIARSDFGGVTLVNRAVKSADGNISRSQDFGVWTQANLAVVKSSLPQSAGTGNRYSAGSAIPFILNPAIARPRSGNAPATLVSGLTVTDILPTNEPRIAVVPSSANKPTGVASIEYCGVCDGSDWSEIPPDPSYGIRWLYAPQTPGTRLAQLTFRAISQVETPTNTTYINTATVSADPSAEAAPASATLPVVVDAPATVLATKVSNDPVIPVGGTFSHQLTLRNNTSNSLNHLDVIDMLPYVADRRSPASTFGGEFSSLAVTGLPARLTAYITSVSPNTLDSTDGTVDGYADPLNPGDTGYSAPGAGRWRCTLAQVDTPTCPTTAQVTAIRFAADGPGLFPAATTFSWAVVMGTAGNDGDDVYTNNFMARVDRSELALPIISPNASTGVIRPGIVVHKDACVGTCDPANDADWSDNVAVPTGGDVALRVKVNNTGNTPGDVVVTNLVPEGTTLVPGTFVPSQGTVDVANNAWNVGPVNAGGDATLTFTVKAGAPVDSSATNATITDSFGQTATGASAPPLVITTVSPSISLVKSIAGTVDVDTNGFTGPGDRVDYAFLVTNTGTVDFTTVAIDDPLITPVTCPAGALAAGAEVTCTGSYTVSDADLATGSVVNTATATGTPANGRPVTSAPATATQPLDSPRPGLALVKSASTLEYDTVGQQVVYSFLVTNTGNVQLSNLQIAETTFTGSGALDAVDCPTTALAPLGRVTCTASYTVSQADLDVGRIDNTAVASGAPPTGPRERSAPSSVAALAAPNTRELELFMASRVIDTNGNGVTDVGDQVIWAVEVTNTGTAALDDVVVEDGSPGSLVCPESALAPGESMECESPAETITAAQVAAGRITNTAVATARDLAGAPVAADPAAAEVVLVPVVVTPPNPAPGPSTAPATGSLSRTGLEVGGALLAAAWLILLGGALLLLKGRTRRVE